MPRDLKKLIPCWPQIRFVHGSDAGIDRNNTLFHKFQQRFIRKIPFVHFWFHECHEHCGQFTLVPDGTWICTSCCPRNRFLGQFLDVRPVPICATKNLVPLWKLTKTIIYICPAFLHGQQRQCATQKPLGYTQVPGVKKVPNPKRREFSRVMGHSGKWTWAAKRILGVLRGKPKRSLGANLLERDTILSGPAFMADANKLCLPFFSVHCWKTVGSIHFCVTKASPRLCKSSSTTSGFPQHPRNHP